MNGCAAVQRRSDMRSWRFAETGQPHMVRHPPTSHWRVSQHAFFRRPGPTPGPSLCLRVACRETIAKRVAGARRLRHLPGPWEGGCASVAWGPLPANRVESVGGAELGICTAFTGRCCWLRQCGKPWRGPPKANAWGKRQCWIGLARSTRFPEPRNLGRLPARNRCPAFSSLSKYLDGQPVRLVLRRDVG